MNLKQLRENASLRTVDVASLVGVSDSTVRNWEQGRTTPRLRSDQFSKLREIYKCSFDELFQAIENTQNLQLIK